MKCVIGFGFVTRFRLRRKVSLLGRGGGACVEGCAGGSVDTGRASHARQVKGNSSDKRGYPGPPGWELGREANHLISVIKVLLLRRLMMDASWIIVVKDRGKSVRTDFYIAT
jgi:hypothetical protein